MVRTGPGCCARYRSRYQMVPTCPLQKRIYVQPPRGPICNNWMLGSIRGMWGSLKAGPGLSHVSGYRRRRVRRRGSPSSLLLAASCALLVAPAWSRAFVVSPVVKDANSRFPFGSSRAQAGRGPPYRRRARGGVGRARTNRGPTLSVASPVEERVRPLGCRV